MKIYVLTEAELKAMITEAHEDGYVCGKLSTCVESLMPKQDVEQLTVSQLLTKITTGK